MIAGCGFRRSFLALLRDIMGIYVDEISDIMSWRHWNDGLYTGIIPIAGQTCKLFSGKWTNIQPESM